MLLQIKYWYEIFKTYPYNIISNNTQVDSSKIVPKGFKLARKILSWNWIHGYTSLEKLPTVDIPHHGSHVNASYNIYIIMDQTNYKINHI